MKVAVISHSSPDYLIDIVADGMVRLFGRNNLFLHYYFNGWAKDARFTHLFEGFGNRNDFPIQEADAVVISNRSDYGMAEDWMKKTGKKNVAVIDGEDDDEIRPQHEIVRAYFKREYMTGRTYPQNVKPLPFAAIPEPIPAIPERALPVLFMSGPSSAIRGEVNAALRDMNVPFILGKLPKDRYNQYLRSARIGISARGAGWDTYRYWETPYFGALLFSQRLAITIPGNFVENEEAIFFDDIPEFRKKLEKLLGSRDLVAQMAATGQRACHERHLSIHRARTVLDAIL